MGIQLYKHNAEAYSRAVRLLENTGRAAVIHPTGTGKTYIAFKLCEDNADSRILWLSPSEYIFKTQLENARRDGFSAENIIFLTYSALLNRTDEDIAALAPDFIVLDEFHRAGAEEWGRRVKYLLPTSVKEVGYTKEATCGCFCPSYHLYYESFTQSTSVLLSATSDAEAQKVVDSFYSAISK